MAVDFAAVPVDVFAFFDQSFFDQSFLN